MISHFPSFYSDETLYSAIARLATRYRLQSDAGSMNKLLYGSRNKHLAFGFPTGIEHLLKLMPPGHSWTADLIIDNHTILPFYEPFLPLHIAVKFRTTMKGEDKVTVPTRGLGISKVSNDTRYLRFCPLCRDADHAQYKESYWRRLHQIPLVKVCPKHQVFLQDSAVNRQSIQVRRDYVPADVVCSPEQVVPVDLNDKSHAFFLWVAEQSQWLLERNCTGSRLIEMKQNYRYFLREQGLATTGGKIDVYELRERLCKFYGHKLLGIMNSSLLADTKEFWLKQWTRNLHRFQPTQRHLLLINFLGKTVESFLTSTRQPTNGQMGPWRCLNPFSSCSGKLTIHKYLLQNRQPKAIFKCPECEYEYSRRFPLTPQDQITPAYIRKRGPVWSQHLLSLWMDPTLNVEEVGRRMGVTQPTVIKYAMREGFPMPRPGTPNWHPTPSMTEVARIRPTRSEATMREVHRSSWLDYRAQHPEKSRSDLNKDCGNTYRWLSRNDSQWLKAHLPPRKMRPKFIVDWPQRDKSLFPLVENICIELIEKAKVAATPPQKIAIAMVQAILKDHKITINISNNLKYLPLTSTALSKYIDESVESLMYRKMNWAIWHCKMHQFRPTFSAFVILARLELIRPRVLSADTIIKSAMSNL